MRKIICVALMAILIAGTTGCSGFLEEDPAGMVAGEGVLADQIGLEAALTGAYAGMARTWSMGLTNGHALLAFALGGDDATCKPAGSGAQQDLRDFDTYNVTNRLTGEGDGMDRAYNGMYKMIQGANNVINNYENTAGDKSVIKIMAGEAHFLRAFAYFYLVRFFGKVPIILSQDFSTEMMSISRSEYSEVYAQIESDLKVAETLLADTRRNNEHGRPNVGSAKALLAEVYLRKAGWPLNESENYALAAAKAKEVIDNHAKYGFYLVEGDAEQNAYQILYSNDEENPVIPEDIFIIPCSNAGGTSNGFVNGWSLPEIWGGWSCHMGELAFFNEFPEGVRKEATYATEFPLIDGSILHYTEMTWARPYFKKLFKKGMGHRVPVSDSNVPIRLLRYTHTVLAYAEAKARSGGPDALAYECLNAIRTRAGLSSLSNLSAEAFADAVVAERAWEFAGEGVRWHDLVRLDMLEEAYNKRDSRDNQRVGTDAWQNHYTFPIKYQETDLNPNLK
jgi:hypothetical protein